MTDMPKYTCHKTVQASKVTAVSTLSSSPFALLKTDHGDFTISTGRGPFEVGGYVVVYEDGFTSYSPAAAFEKGYTLVE